MRATEMAKSAATLCDPCTSRLTMISLIMTRFRSAASGSLSYPASRRKTDLDQSGIGEPCPREPRQQAADGNGQGGAAEDVADAVMRSGAEGHDPLGVAVDVEAQGIGKHLGIV